MDNTTDSLTDQDGTEHAAPVKAGNTARLTPKSPEGLARQRAGKRSGGKHMRNAALVGLDGGLPSVSLRSSDARLSILEATLAAAVAGKTSGMVAQTIIALVKEARAESLHELEALVQRQAQRLAEYESGAVVDARAGR